MSTLPTVALQELDPASRAPRRVRHEPRRRELEVKRVERIAAHMIRVTLGGDLEGFTSLGFDDHVKLFFPDEPRRGGEPPTACRATTRRADTIPSAKTLDIEFVHPRRRAGDALGRAGAAGQTLRDRRAARLLHHPDQFRLAPADRRRHRTAGDRATAGRAAGRHARGGAGRGGRSGRRGDVRERRRCDRHLGASERRGSRHHRRAGEDAQDTEPAGGRLLRLGGVRVARRPRRCAPSSSPTTAPIPNG